MIYLDYNSTTPVHEEVLSTMLPFFNEKFGNAASVTHPYGWSARQGVEKATEYLAALLSCGKSEIIHTSGATESINLAMKGVFRVYRRKGNHIITAATEHKAVLDTCRSLEKQGARLTVLPTDTNGLIDLEDLRRAISDQTLMVCIMYVNNETGVIQPLKEIAEITHEHHSIFLCDATQAVGKMPIDLRENRIDLMPFSAHKFYGPKGAGGLFVRRRDPRVILEPLIEGGGHQRGLRSGTMNVPGIVGLGAAAKIALREMGEDARKLSKMKQRLESELSQLSGVKVNGAGAPRLFNTSNLCFSGIKAADIINAVKTKVAVSAGSACTAEEQQPSHVLMSMGLNEADASSSVRFSLGKFTTGAEITETIGIFRERLESMKSLRGSL